MILRIFNKDIPIRNLIFVVGEGVLIYTTILISAFLRYGTAEASFLSIEVLVKAVVITVVCLTSIYLNDLYQLKVTDTYLELGFRLTRAMGVTCIILSLVYYCTPSLLVGRGIVIISILFFIVVGISWRYAYNYSLKRKMFTEKVLLLGSGELCLKIVDELSHRRDCGYQVTGLVSTNSDSTLRIPREIPVFSVKQGLFELVDFLMPKRIVVAMDQKRGNLPARDLLRCKLNGIEILEGESFYEKLTGKILVEKTNPSWFIFSAGFRKSKFTRIAKRITELLLASFGLLVASPLIGLISLAIKMDSKGPVIFRQVRCGEGERTFELCKFRSMVENAEEVCGPTWAQEDDYRVTRVGRILRKYRLDEIPQMWNVLKGDMSFVGPRPERPEFVEKLQEVIPYYSVRHAVKPGITGWAQISFGYGASVEDALEKLRYDLFYIKNMNILMDLMIILRTIKVVLNDRAVSQSGTEQQHRPDWEGSDSVESIAVPASPVPLNKQNPTREAI